MTFRPDPKPENRKVASRDEWEAIVGEKSGPCRGCGGRATSFHHLVPRSLRGDDVPSNIVPLCGSGTTGCHGAIECHTAGWQQVAHAIRHSLTALERAYIVGKKNKAWFDRAYPAGEDDLCAKCRKPKTQVKREPAKRRQRWTILVPADGEDGAAVLDALVEGCGSELTEIGYDAGTPKYHVLAAVLTDWLSDRHPMRSAA